MKKYIEPKIRSYKNILRMVGDGNRHSLKIEKGAEDENILVYNLLDEIYHGIIPEKDVGIVRKMIEGTSTENEEYKILKTCRKEIILRPQTPRLNWGTEN